MREAFKGFAGSDKRLPGKDSLLTAKRALREADEAIRRARGAVNVYRQGLPRNDIIMTALGDPNEFDILAVKGQQGGWEADKWIDLQIKAWHDMGWL